MGSEPWKYIGEVVMGINASKLTGLNNSHHHGGHFCSLMGTGEHPILPSDCHGSNRLLDRVVVDLVSSISCIHTELFEA